MLANQYQKYQQNAIFTASPQELTLMLYNGAIKFCNLGLEMMEQKSIEKTNYYIQKAESIIEELLVTLDDQYEISKEIKLLYEYIMSLLEQANIQKEAAKLEEAKELITQFRDTWKEAMQLSRIGGVRN